MTRGPLAVAFDPHLRVAEGSELYAHGLAEFAATIRGSECRRRRRRVTDSARHAEAVSCLLANVVAANAGAPGAALAVRRRARDGGRVATDAPVFGSGLNAAVAAAECAGLFVPGKLGVYSVCEPTAKLLAMIPAEPIGSQLALAVDQPAILLRGRKGADGRAPVLPFDPAAVTQELRDMHAVNAWLRTLPLEVTDPAAWTVPTRDFRLVRVVTPHARACTRIFINGTFAHGGRLFRAFWLHMRKAERFARLRLAGEPVAEVDYRSMFLRLAYHSTGARWPFGGVEDGYAPPGASDSERAGYKTCTTGLLHGLRGWQFPADTAAHFAEGTSARDVYARIRARHPALQAGGVFGSLIGHQLARLESDLMVALLLRCRDAGLAAVGLHDALLVPTSRGEEAAAMMETEAASRLGCELPTVVRRGV